MKRRATVARRKSPASKPRKRPTAARKRSTSSGFASKRALRVERSLAKLVLSLVEFLRQVMERQAVRRMDEGTLSADEVESMGTALMRLEETLHEMAARFGLTPADLHLDLGPLGRLT